MPSAPALRPKWRAACFAAPSHSHPIISCSTAAARARCAPPASGSACGRPSFTRATSDQRVLLALHDATRLRGRACADVGTGTGISRCRRARRRARVVAVDINPNAALAAAATRARTASTDRVSVFAATSCRHSLRGEIRRDPVEPAVLPASRATSPTAPGTPAPAIATSRRCSSRRAPARHPAAASTCCSRRTPTSACSAQLIEQANSTPDWSGANRC